MTSIAVNPAGSLALKTKVESISNPENAILKRLKEFATGCASNKMASYSRMHNRHNRS